ncbi:hypothetical protein DIPPA_07935 [Diplonema papillatum]|nr:hypothetical protein DIPPA_07935 [Diplonema papillatum]
MAERFYVNPLAAAYDEKAAGVSRPRLRRKGTLRRTDVLGGSLMLHTERRKGVTRREPDTTRRSRKLDAGEIPCPRLAWTNGLNISKLKVVKDRDVCVRSAWKQADTVAAQDEEWRVHEHLQRRCPRRANLHTCLGKEHRYVKRASHYEYVPFLVFEHFDGTLAGAFSRVPPPAMGQVVEWLGSLVDQLLAVFASGVHQVDISPDAIVFDGSRVLLSGFKTARVMAADAQGGGASPLSDSGSAAAACSFSAASTAKETSPDLLKFSQFSSTSTELEYAHRKQTLREQALADSQQLCDIIRFMLNFGGAQPFSSATDRQPPRQRKRTDRRPGHASRHLEIVEAARISEEELASVMKSADRTLRARTVDARYDLINTPEAEDLLWLTSSEKAKKPRLELSKARHHPFWWSVAEKVAFVRAVHVFLSANTPIVCTGGVRALLQDERATASCSLAAVTWYHGTCAWRPLVADWMAQFLSTQDSHPYFGASMKGLLLFFLTVVDRIEAGHLTLSSCPDADAFCHSFCNLRFPGLILSALRSLSGDTLALSGCSDLPSVVQHFLS